MAEAPTYRAEPDPGFADRLEQVLLQRLTAPSDALRSSRGVTPSDAPVRTDIDPHQQGDVIMLDTEARRTEDVAATPRHRRPSTWLMAAAAAVAIAVVGTLLVAADSDEDDEQIDTVTPAPGVTSSPTTAAPAQNAMGMPGPSAPGRWFVDPDGDAATPLRVSFQVPEGWASWFGATKYVEGDADGFTGLSITTVTNLVSDGCRDHTALDPPVGPTVDDLATALSELAPFEVTARPTDVTLLGHQGKHLELTVPAMRIAGGGDATLSKNVARFMDCVEGELHSWISPINDRSPGLLGHSAGSPLRAFNAYQAPGQTEEFWILDVEGTRVVLVAFDSPASPAADIAERDAIFDSIRFEP
jgi:hypothetical protein